MTLFSTCGSQTCLRCTDTQCNTIQHPMINAALPKHRTNRNIPQRVVFGPLQYGSLDILSLSTEQICKHTTRLTIISHLRSKSSTGMNLHHLILAFEIYIRCEFPFWGINPEDYPYAPSPQTSRISHMWHKLRSIGTTLYVRDMWTPTSKHKNDVSIMSTMQDLQIISQGDTDYITDINLYKRNACTYDILLLSMRNIKY